LKKYIKEIVDKYEIKEKLYREEWSDVDKYQNERKRRFEERISQI